EGQLPTVIRLAETGSATALAEQAADPTYANARSLADALRALPEPGRILVDEQYADHLVVLSGQFGRFITSRDSDYREVIADPSKGAAYVLVGNVAAGQGILATQRPELFDIGAEGLQLAGEWPGTRVETWRLYEVTNRAAEALVPPSPASDTGQ
ncbi:MAG: hypothetical protein CL878_11165, partial [Dehalococcoidia bacterium]|nr:hypothetical protein [Dehalococcoidia bacterium]